ncbi:MAG: amidase [Deltaproteobacteria bacterium]|nr:amidase [Deltaproteobacteria bacterium]MBW2536626.1 amidase [Deltaproteobacteria bacterium]
MHELLTLPAVELARRTGARKISPVEVVDAHIRRIEQVNPRLNALVVPTFETAREEARRAEEAVARRSRDELPPLFGVPFTVKELIAVEGLPHTAGVVARRGVVASADAPLVARLRAAGAILLGLTNVSEAGLWLETYNMVYGRTNNARSRWRISGGSTGGEGAIIAAGGSPMGIGADIGGSIRNPSFFNGIAGHKPTGGLLPSTGHWPPAEGERGRHCVSGPMARTVDDLVAMMTAFSPDIDPHRDPDHGPFRPLGSIDRSKVTVYYFASNGLARPSREMAQTIEQTARALGEAGFRTEPWRPAGMRRAAEIWGAVVSDAGDQSVRELLGNGQPVDLVGEWLRKPLGRSNHPFTSLVMGTFERLARVTEQRTTQLRRMAVELRARIESRLGDRGVLMCPPYPRTAPLHWTPVLSPLAFSYCGVFNAMHMPSTAVPTGLGRSGLALGVQIAAKRFNDPLCLEVARAVEQAFGGFLLATP